MITFIVPCFNEENNILKTLKTIREIDLRHEVIVIDDGSTDKTFQKAERYRLENYNEKIMIIKNLENRGLSYSYAQGVSFSNEEYVMAVFGDHSEPLEALQLILKEIGKADIIIPYINQNQRPFFRGLLSNIFVTLVNILTGNYIRYYNGPVLHKRMNLIGRNRGEGFGYQAEILTELIKEGKTFKEIQIPINQRQEGSSKAFKLKNLIQVLRSLIRIAKRRLK